VPLAKEAQQIAKETANPYDDVLAGMLAAAGDKMTEIATSRAARALVAHIIEQHRPVSG
jgi:hypothetical protein